MTVVNTSFDYRAPTPNIFGGTFMMGPTGSRATSGGDRSAADKAAGLWPDHAYSGTRINISYGSVTVDRDDPYFGFKGTGLAPLSAYGVNVGPDPVWTANDELKLVGSLANKYRLSDWNVGIFVGELGKTTDTVAGRVKQLGRALIRVKRGDVTGALQILKENQKNFRTIRNKHEVNSRVVRVARGKEPTWYQSWLELRYAWRPLVKDIYDLSEAIQTLDRPRKRVIRVGHYVERQPPTALDVYNTADGNGRLSKYIKATISEKPFSLPEHLGLTNPEAVAWELLPWSFVFDWFIPIGNWIQARNTLSGMTGSFVRTTFNWYDYYVVSKPGYIITSPGFWRRYYNSKGGIKSMTINRTLHSTIGVPLPAFRNPSGANPGTRLIDALALIKQVSK